MINFIFKLGGKNMLLVFFIKSSNVLLTFSDPVVFLSDVNKHSSVIGNWIKTLSDEQMTL